MNILLSAFEDIKAFKLKREKYTVSIGKMTILSDFLNANILCFSSLCTVKI